MELLLNGRDVSEVLSSYGILILDFLLNRSIKRCRFIQKNKVEMCSDGALRSTVLELESGDFPAFLQQCAEITARGEGDSVVLSLNSRDLVALDWFNFGFIGDGGNFSKADKLQLVQLHLNTFKELLRDSVDSRNLFALYKDDGYETNYLTLHRRNYLDAGGVYEADSRFYAREFFLIVALQNYQHLIAECLSSKRLNYNLTTDWMPVSAAFATFVTEQPREGWPQYSAGLSSFGDKGKTLRMAQAR